MGFYCPFKKQGSLSNSVFLLRNECATNCKNRCNKQIQLLADLTSPSFSYGTLVRHILLFAEISFLLVCWAQDPSWNGSTQVDPWTSKRPIIWTPCKEFRGRPGSLPEWISTWSHIIKEYFPLKGSLSSQRCFLWFSAWNEWSPGWQRAN